MSVCLYYGHCLYYIDRIKWPFYLLHEKIIIFNQLYYISKKKNHTEMGKRILKLKAYIFINKMALMKFRKFLPLLHHEIPKNRRFWLFLFFFFFFITTRQPNLDNEFVFNGQKYVEKKTIHTRVVKKGQNLSDSVINGKKHTYRLLRHFY